MKAHLVLYIEIVERNAASWFNEASRAIRVLESGAFNVCHAETIDGDMDIEGGP